MPSPQVSVIMPIFKPKFLATAIDSILAQTMPDFELILINDGSPFPQVTEIGNDYSRRDSRIRYIEQANRGVAATRNAGAALASADYLIWMDDDDISLPDRIKEKFDFLRKNTAVASVNCTYAPIDGDGQIKRRHRGKAYPPLREKVIQTPPPPFFDSLYPDSLYFTPWPMIRRSVYETLGGMRPWFRVAEDVDFALRLEEKFPFAILPQTLFLHRTASGKERRLSQRPDSFFYDYAAKWAAFCRRRGEADPINETTDLNDLLRHLPDLPHHARHNFIRRWGKSRRRSLSSDNLATFKRDLASLQQMLPTADGKEIRRMKWKVIKTALIKGHWRYFIPC